MQQLLWDLPQLLVSAAAGAAGVGVLAWVGVGRRRSVLAAAAFVGTVPRW